MSVFIFSYFFYVSFMGWILFLEKITLSSESVVFFFSPEKSCLFFFLGCFHSYFDVLGLFDFWVLIWFC